MSQDFYPDLKTLEDGLFVPELVENFITKYGLSLIIQNATSATNEKSKNRLRDLFRRISNTHHLGQILLYFNSSDEKKVKLLTKFMNSENSSMLFEHFQNYSEQLVKLIQKEPKHIGQLLKLIQHESGIKVLKTFQKVYKKHPQLEALYSEEAKHQLSKGIQNQDTTIAMRYIQLVTNIATYSENAFTFINSGNMLEQALNHYNTTDTLLKLNVVEVIEAFGNSSLTGEYLRKSNIWQQIVKEAFNQDQEFYVRKSLIVLVAKMSSLNCFQITPSVAKQFGLFLKQMLSSKIVDEIDAGLDVVSYLGKTSPGFNIISHSEQITQLYVAISRATGQNTRIKYVASLDSIVDRKSGNKSYATVVTLLSCIGDPTLAKTNNLTGSHPILSALPQFAKWFYSYLLLPFQQLKLACLQLFRQLLAYKQVCVELFGNKNCIQFFKKKLYRPDLILIKKKLIEDILKHGDSTWKGHELQVFTNVLRNQMAKGQSTQVQYQVQSK